MNKQPVRQTLARLTVFVLSLICAFVGLMQNCVPIVLERSSDNLYVRMLGAETHTKMPLSTEALTITRKDHPRFSTRQAIINETTWLQTTLSAIRAFAGYEPGELSIRLAGNSHTRLLWLNPFGTTLTISGAQEPITVVLNIPDGAADLYTGSNAQHLTVESPWIKLIFATMLLVTALASALGAIIAPIGGMAARDGLNSGMRTHAWISSTLIFGLGASVTYYIGSTVFTLMPAFGDEINYLLQAKIFAGGHSSIPEPAFPAFFRVDWMHVFGADRKIWGFHPPGNSLLLMVGWLIGVYWITVPIIGGLIFLVQYQLAYELFGSRRAAWLHIVVFGSSHYVLSLASVFMAHAPCMLFISLGYLDLVKLSRNHRYSNLYRSALWFGFAFVIRPLSTVLAVIVPIFVLVWRGQKTRAHFITFAKAVLIFALVASAAFFYTYLNSGSWSLSYMIKGPEVGKSLSYRLMQGISEHSRNFFRNWNEFLHRCHSFGLFGNLIFFFVPVMTTPWRRLPEWMQISYTSFMFYLLAHSLLHWYGWKWEPRMLYEASFLFYLITTAGLLLVIEGQASRWVWKRVTTLIIVGSLGWALFADVPQRMNSEYKNYNFFSPNAFVRDAYMSGGLKKSLVFFTQEISYASYLPFNDLNFDGSTIFALSAGLLPDHQLISRYPDHKIFYTASGSQISESVNFYTHDISRLSKEEVLSAPTSFLVIPWKDYIPPNSLGSVAPRSVSPIEFIKHLRDRWDSGSAIPETVLLVDKATSMIPTIESLFETAPVQLGSYETTVLGIRLGARKAREGLRIRGFRTTCHQGVDFRGAVTFQGVSPIIDPALCPGEFISIEWEALFELPKSRELIFEMSSDDGAALTIDDRDIGLTRLDGGIHGPKSGAVTLEAGIHRLKVRYFNGPGPSFLTLREVHTNQPSSGTPSLPDDASFFIYSKMLNW